MDEPDIIDQFKQPMYGIFFLYAPSLVRVLIPSGSRSFRAAATFFKEPIEKLSIPSA